MIIFVQQLNVIRRHQNILGWDIMLWGFLSTYWTDLQSCSPPPILIIGILRWLVTFYTCCVKYGKIVTHPFMEHHEANLNNTFTPRYITKSNRCVLISQHCTN